MEISQKPFDTLLRISSTSNNDTAIMIPPPIQLALKIEILARCVKKAMNEAESIRSAIRNYLAHRRSLFLDISINKRILTVAKYILKSEKENIKLDSILVSILCNKINNIHVLEKFKKKFYKKTSLKNLEKNI